MVEKKYLQGAISHTQEKRCVSLKSSLAKSGSSRKTFEGKLVLRMRLMGNLDVYLKKAKLTAEIKKVKTE